MWETNVDENETRYRTKLDTTSKMTALKSAMGAEHTQDEMMFQGMRKLFPHRQTEITTDLMATVSPKESEQEPHS